MSWTLIAFVVLSLALVGMIVMGVVGMVRLGRDLRRRDQTTAMLLAHQQRRDEASASSGEGT